MDYHPISTKIGEFFHHGNLLVAHCGTLAHTARLAAILESLPPICPQAPYNHAEDLDEIVRGLFPTFCRLYGKEQEEFMVLFDGVMDIWEDVPHTDNLGRRLPTSERREGYKSSLYQKRDMVRFTRKEYTFGKRRPEEGPWQMELDPAVHLSKKNACIARSLDPNDSRRRFTLEAQRFRRVKKHVDHEICVYGGLDIPVPPEEAGQCPCLYGV